MTALVDGVDAGAEPLDESGATDQGVTEAALARALSVARARAMHPAGSGLARPLRIVGDR